MELGACTGGWGKDLEQPQGLGGAREVSDPGETHAHGSRSLSLFRDHSAFAAGGTPSCGSLICGPDATTTLLGLSNGLSDRVSFP